MPLSDSDFAVLDAIHQRIDRIETELNAYVAGMKQLGTDLQANTAITKEIQEMAVSVKVGMKILIWLGSSSTAVLAVWGLIYAILHGSPAS